MLWAPFIAPLPVDINPPWQWYRYSSWNDWYDNLDDDNRPNEFWLSRWFVMVVHEARLHGTTLAEQYTNGVRDWLLSVIGPLRAGFPSTGDWLWYVDSMVGFNLPGWVVSVVWGLDWLRDKLPVSIRDGWQTWSEIWDTIKASVRDWAIARYDAAKWYAELYYAWRVAVGDWLSSWYLEVRDWVLAFKFDPYYTITGYLGGAWDWLIWFASSPQTIVASWLGWEWQVLGVFARDCLTFYYNLWADGWSELASLVSDPLTWVYDRVEAVVIDRW